MKKMNPLLAVVFILALMIFYACRHEILFNPAGNGVGQTGTNPPATTVACSPDSVYFINEIMPLISSNCTMSGCHDNISHKEGVVLTTYSNILRYVQPGNAANSKLYKEIIRTDKDRMPPPPMSPFTQIQKEKIFKWINQGAKYNYCAASCDTSISTYSGALKSIMQNKCAGCHNQASLGGNIDLSTYNGLKTVALNGKLYGSITQQPGFAAMPKNATKLSDCEIKQVQKWINAGSLNN